MIHVADYCAKNKLSRRHAYRLISAGTICSQKIKGQRYIIIPPTVDLVNPSNQSPESFKKEIREFVHKAGKPYLSIATKRIEEYERLTGQKLKGLSKRALYRLANKEQTVYHKKRNDSGTAKNPNLVKSLKLVETIAAKLYMDMGSPNIRFVVTRLQELAKENESLYEIAAIPQPTLYRYLRQWIKNNDLDQCYLYFNKHKSFLKKLPKIAGAFTDNIEFMDYIAFDDRKADVAGSWYYDEISGKTVLRKVWYWIAIEMLTMKPVGWVILPREPNGDDVINVLIQSMLNVGLPKKGYLFDNGIGFGEKVKDFMSRIKTMSAGSGYFEKPYIPVAPYEPTHKANIERFNRFLKDEYDVWYKNFVGGNRDEVRHSGKRLMPEDCDHLVEEYISKASAYLTGDCVNRTRDKVIKGKKYRASINSIFDKQLQSYQQFSLSEQSIKWALMDDSQVKVYRGGITLKKNGISFTYSDMDYNPGLEGKQFIISMLPTNMSRMDLYAAEDFLDTTTGAKYERGQYVITLHSMRELPQADQQRVVFKKHSQARKHAKAVKESLLDAALAQFPDLLPLVNTHITIDGHAIDVRKNLLKRMDSITEATPLSSIAAYIKEEVKAISENVGTELTFGADEEDDNCIKLTVDGEEI